MAKLPSGNQKGGRKDRQNKPSEESCLRERHCLQRAGGVGLTHRCAGNEASVRAEEALAGRKSRYFVCLSARQELRA
jgi:hypothetical protein